MRRFGLNFRDMIALSLVFRGFIICVWLVKKRTFFNGFTFPIHIFVGIFVNVTRSWDRGIRVRNAIPTRMGFAR
jgi:hypothetical protein